MARGRRTRNAGERFRITATVERFDEKNGSHGPLGVILLKDVCDASTGITLTDQLWLAAGGWAEHLAAGDQVAITMQMPAGQPKTGGTKDTKAHRDQHGPGYMRDYMREYMRRRRAAAKASRVLDPDGRG